MEPDILTLKVGSATDPAKFAGAIYKNLEEGKTVAARSLGASANFTMSKGISLAHEFFRSHGKELWVQLSSTNQTMDNGDQIRSFTADFSVTD